VNPTLAAFLDELARFGAENDGRETERARRMLNITPETGRLLWIMVRATRATRILGVGTSNAYSTIWLADAARETDGRVTTLELNPEKVTLARGNLAKAGLADRVEIRQGSAAETLTTLTGPFDFVFLDADKEGQLDYFEKLYPKKLAPGGIIAVHNAIRAREAMKSYLEAISKHPDFDSVILSLTMEDGFSVSYRQRHA
jgi:predicted O-methyltransferase YrrM